MLCLIKSLFPFLPFPLCFSFPFLLFPFPFYVVVSLSFPFSFFPLFLPSTPPVLSRVSQDSFPLSLFVFVHFSFPHFPFVSTHIVNSSHSHQLCPPDLFLLYRPTSFLGGNPSKTFHHFRRLHFPHFNSIFLSQYYIFYRYLASPLSNQDALNIIHHQRKHFFVE